MMTLVFLKFLPLWTIVTGLTGVHVPSKFLGNFCLRTLGAPVARGPRIIDTVDTAVATPLDLSIHTLRHREIESDFVL